MLCSCLAGECHSPLLCPLLTFVQELLCLSAGSDTAGTFMRVTENKYVRSSLRCKKNFLLFIFLEIARWCRINFYFLNYQKRYLRATVPLEKVEPRCKSRKPLIPSASGSNLPSLWSSWGIIFPLRKSVCQWRNPPWLPPASCFSFQSSISTPDPLPLLKNLFPSAVFQILSENWVCFWYRLLCHMDTRKCAE